MLNSIAIQNAEEKKCKSKINCNGQIQQQQQKYRMNEKAKFIEMEAYSK